MKPLSLSLPRNWARELLAELRHTYRDVWTDEDDSDFANRVRSVPQHIKENTAKQFAERFPDRTF
jgi:hypothetical protein